jgi:outer membrane lipopolysaccharide assembly protein LptE/RlpB
MTIEIEVEIDAATITMIVDETTTEAVEIAVVAEDSPVEVVEAEAEEEAAADVARDLTRLKSAAIDKRRSNAPTTTAATTSKIRKPILPAASTRST